MMNCEQAREYLVLHQPDSELKGTKRNEFFKHLRVCHSCQIEYEGLLHTAEVIGNLETPEPPPELLTNIQAQIRKIDKRSRTAMFASPFSWVFGKFKLELSPQIVNCTALVCYVLASAFLLKFAFFTEVKEDSLGLTAFQEARLRNARVSPSPWATLKHQHIRDESESSTNVTTEGFFTPSDQSIGIKMEEIWYSNTVNDGTDTGEGRFINDANVKLTLFWSDIKTEL